MRRLDGKPECSTFQGCQALSLFLSKSIRQSRTEGPDHVCAVGALIDPFLGMHKRRDGGRTEERMAITITSRGTNSIKYDVCVSRLSGLCSVSVREACQATNRKSEMFNFTFARQVACSKRYRSCSNLDLIAKDGARGRPKLQNKPLTNS